MKPSGWNRVLHGVARKAFWGAIYGRMRYSVIFTRIGIKDWPPGFQCPSILLWKKSSLDFIKPRRKDRIHTFCAIGSVPYSLCPQSASLASVSYCALATTTLPSQAHVWSSLGALGVAYLHLGPMQQLGPHGCYKERIGESTDEQTHVTRRERASFPLLGSLYILVL